MRKKLRMSARLVTAEELERFPSDDNRYELVAGHRPDDSGQLCPRADRFRLE